MNNNPYEPPAEESAKPDLPEPRWSMFRAIGFSSCGVVVMALGLSMASHSYGPYTRTNAIGYGMFVFGSGIVVVTILRGTRE
jgi:hypothetical protein